MLLLDGNAAFRRAVIRPGKVKEDGAAAAMGARAHIVVEHDQQVIEVVVAPQPFVRGAVGPADRPVVIGVERRVTPAIIRCDRPDRQQRLRSGNAVGAIADFERPQLTGRCGAVTLALHPADPGAAERARQHEAAGDQMAVMGHGAGAVDDLYTLDRLHDGPTIIWRGAFSDRCSVRSGFTKVPGPGLPGWPIVKQCRYRGKGDSGSSVGDLSLGTDAPGKTP